MKINSVLIVEDEPFILDIYTEILKSEGIAVTAVKNGQEALELIEQNKIFDLILLDIMMPRLSGLEFLQATKDQLKAERVKVILLTNLPDRDIFEQCRQLGSLGEIIKSDITPGELLPKIEEILNESSSI